MARTSDCSQVGGPPARRSPDGLCDAATCCACATFPFEGSSTREVLSPSISVSGTPEAFLAQVAGQPL